MFVAIGSDLEGRDLHLNTPGDLKLDRLSLWHSFAMFWIHSACPRGVTKVSRPPRRLCLRLVQGHYLLHLSKGLIHEFRRVAESVKSLRISSWTLI